MKRLERDTEALNATEAALQIFTNLKHNLELQKAVMPRRLHKATSELLTAAILLKYDIYKRKLTC